MKDTTSPIGLSGRLRQLLWFVGLWALGVGVVGLISLLLRAVLV